MLYTIRDARTYMRMLSSFCSCVHACLFAFALTNQQQNVFFMYVVLCSHCTMLVTRFFGVSSILCVCVLCKRNEDGKSTDRPIDTYPSCGTHCSRAHIAIAKRTDSLLLRPYADEVDWIVRAVCVIVFNLIKRATSDNRARALTSTLHEWWSDHSQL